MQLPRELWNEIFFLCDASEIVGILSRVCNAWYTLSKSDALLRRTLPAVLRNTRSPLKMAKLCCSLKQFHPKALNWACSCISIGLWHQTSKPDEELRYENILEVRLIDSCDFGLHLRDLFTSFGCEIHEWFFRQSSLLICSRPQDYLPAKYSIYEFINWVHRMYDLIPSFEQSSPYRPVYCGPMHTDQY